MFANPLNLAGGTALPTGILKKGWENNMIEAYTDCQAQRAS